MPRVQEGHANDSVAETLPEPAVPPGGDIKVTMLVRVPTTGTGPKEVRCRFIAVYRNVVLRILTGKNIRWLTLMSLIGYNCRQSRQTLSAKAKIEAAGGKVEIL
jgi:hypothetical protein